MKYTLNLLALFCFHLFLIHGEITVTFPTENATLGPYRTTRFSELIGTFSSECVLSTSAIILGRNEDPCKRSSIKTDLTGLIVFTDSIETLHCYPERSYKNLEHLGAVAVVNTGKRPAGSNMYVNHFGYPIGDGTVPFLDTSLEFREDVYQEMKDSDEAFVIVEIDGCDDENEFKFCYEVIDMGVSWCIIPVTLLNIYTARNSLRKTKITRGTAPRIFLLKFYFYQNIFMALSFLLNVSPFNTYFWLTEGRYKLNLSFLFQGIEAALFFFGTLLCAYYWFYSAKICFANTNFYDFGYLRGSAYYFCYGYTIISFLVTQYFLQRPGAFFAVIPISFLLTDIVVCLVFCFSNKVFLSKVIEAFQDTTPKESLKTELSRCTRLTGFGFETYLEQQDIHTDLFSFKTWRLVAHLSKWLFRYVCIYPVIPVFSGLLRNHMYFYDKEEDSIPVEFCLMSVYQFGIYIPRLLMVYCLINAVSGIQQKKPTTRTIRHFISTTA
eukprot:snap_masked-scaffold_13-processed-gene-9.46-mRNA-1 protein AED:1.00 eAED:1.00 QI:0/0/0/0/1/1/2/0/494